MHFDKEQYLEWLERLDLDVKDTVTKSRLQRVLREEFGMEPTQAQTDALFQAAHLKFDELIPEGFAPVLIERKTGRLQLFRELATGRFISFAKIKSRLGL